MPREEIARKLKQLRESKGLTQKEVGAYFNKAYQTVASWESGQSQPDADTLLQLCDLYSVVDIMATFRPDIYKGIPSKNEAQEIAILFDKADEHDKETVRHVLGRYKGIEVAEESHPDIKGKAM